MQNKKKSSLLIVLIYLIFVGLGLPDTIFGIAWPSIRQSLGLPLEAGGIITMTVTFSTAISSFFSGYILKSIGTPRLVFISTLLSAFSLFLFSISTSLGWLTLCAVPLGISAGAIDTGVNHYVAIKYSSRKMNWLHSFWGVGAFLGPGIITYSISYMNDWHLGYQTIATLILIISLLTGLTLSFWGVALEAKESESKVAKANIFLQPGVFLSILAFPIYITIEMGVGVWLASYLIEGRGLQKLEVGFVVTLYYVCIVVGRFLSGFIIDFLSPQKILNFALLLLFIGALFLVIKNNVFVILSIAILGFGCAPIFPNMIQNAPKLFGDSASQVIIGYQIGSSYLSGVLILPLIGLLSSRISIEVIPVTILVFVVLLAIILNSLNRISRSNPFAVQKVE